MNDQRSLADQLKTLYQLANKNGLYDAADWLRTSLERMGSERNKSCRPLTESQSALLETLKAVSLNAWTTVQSPDVRSARALARRGLICLRGDEGQLEARVIEVGS